MADILETLNDAIKRGVEGLTRTFNPNASLMKIPNNFWEVLQAGDSLNIPKAPLPSFQVAKTEITDPKVLQRMSTFARMNKINVEPPKRTYTKSRVHVQGFDETPSDYKPYETFSMPYIPSSEATAKPIFSNPLPRSAVSIPTTTNMIPGIGSTFDIGNFWEQMKNWGTFTANGQTYDWRAIAGAFFLPVIPLIFGGLGAAGAALKSQETEETHPILKGITDVLTSFMPAESSDEPVFLAD